MLRCGRNYLSCKSHYRGTDRIRTGNEVSHTALQAVAFNHSATVPKQAVSFDSRTLALRIKASIDNIHLTELLVTVKILFVTNYTT